MFLFLSKGNYYISNVAVYPEDRGIGVRKKLFFEELIIIEASIHK